MKQSRVVECAPSQAHNAFASACLSTYQRYSGDDLYTRTCHQSDVDGVCYEVARAFTAKLRAHLARSLAVIA